MIKLVIALIGLFFQPYYIWRHYQDEKERIARNRGRAEAAGFTFTDGIHRRMRRQYRFLNKVAGSGHYALNIMEGNFGGHSVTMFDYHRSSLNSKAKVWEYSKWIKREYCSFFCLDLEKDFPDLSVGKESNGLGFFARIGDAVGFGDIDFESHEFSEKFDVRGSDKKFAYDFCNAQMMEHLLSQRPFPIEVEANVLAISYDSLLERLDIESSVERLLAIRERMPAYLFAS